MCRIVHFHTIYAEPKASDSARCSQSERVIGLLAGRAATEFHESRCPLRTPLDDVSLVPHTGTACPSGTCREARLESNRRNSVSAKAKCRRDGSGCPLSRLSPFSLSPFSFSPPPFPAQRLWPSWTGS